MKLKKGVYYQKYGSVVYVRDVLTRRDYLMNESSFVVLEGLSQKEGVEKDKLTCRMREAYPEASLEDVETFLAALGEEHLLEEDFPAETENVRDRVLKLCMDENRLFSVCLELTYRCNEKCLHCYVDGDDGGGRELDVDDYRKILDEIWDMGCISILLTGGECLLKEEVFEIVEYASSLGMLVDLYSNGLNLTREGLARLKKMKINSLSFSLYGSCPEVHDAVTQVKGSFEQTLKSVMMTKCAGIDTYIKAVVMKQNYDDIESFLELGKLLEIDVTPALMILDKRDGHSAREFRLGEVEKYCKVKELMRKYEGNLQERGRRDIDYYPCAAGRSTLSISPYGDIYPCISLPVRLGNVRESSIREVWNHSEQLEEIRTLRFRDLCSKSGNCDYAGGCVICMGALEYCGNEKKWKIPSEICMIAEADDQITHERR